jgi:hypothetical protein
LETKGKDFFKLIYPTETIHIEPVSHDIGYCVDGDFNSITIIYINNNEEVPKLTNDFCTIESKGWLVEKSSITNVSIEFDKNDTEIKLLIHFHSKMIRGDEMDKIKKKINRTNNIKNILKK